MSRKRLLSRLLICAIATLATLATVSTPALAHSTGAPEATNYRSEISSVEPDVAGVDVHVENLDEELALTNRSERDVTVLGYDHEPYLRVGPSGVFVNTRSPAHYLNRTAEGETRPPPDADPASEPRWTKLTSSHTVHWHDHRAHWMQTDPPPQVRADPNGRHVIDADWQIELRHGDVPVLVTGTLVWEPGPQPIRWYALIVLTVLASIVATLPRVPRARVVTTGVFALFLGVGVVGIVDELTAMTGSIATRFGSGFEAITPALIGLIIGIYGMVRSWNKALDGPWYLLFSALTLGVLAGANELDVFTHSQLPTTLPYWVARSTVALAIGLGVGLAIASVLRIRSSRLSRP